MAHFEYIRDREIEQRRYNALYAGLLVLAAILTFVAIIISYV